MGNLTLIGMAVGLTTLAAASVPLVAQNTQQEPQQAAPPAASAPALARGDATGLAPSVTVLDTEEVQGILGREVRSAADENMGRIVDVIVDAVGQPRAAIIDFGGFLGVGSRKIAVDWKALRFSPAASQRYRISLELTRDQVKPAPEYKDGRPVVVLGSLGNLEPLSFGTSPTLER